VTLPGVRTADHVGITVPDLEEGVRFFAGVLGFEERYSHRPPSTRGEVQVRQFNRHPDTEIVGIAMLRLGTLNLELFEFRAPDQRQECPRISDWGGTHLAFYVDDLDAAVEHLRDHDVRVLGEPMALPGPEAGPGNRFVFALGPGGIPIELVSYPEGKAYERTTHRRLFDPRAHERWAP
jgi:glyoxylase I family protein